MFEAHKEAKTFAESFMRLENEDLRKRLAALQTENGLKDKEIKRLNFMIDSAKNVVIKRGRELSRVEAERDAARQDCAVAEENHHKAVIERDAAISDVPHDCEHCKHAIGSGACKLLPDGDQFSPDYTEGFDRDGNCDHWKWRSAQGEV